MLKTTMKIGLAGAALLATMGAALAQDFTMRVHQFLPAQSTIPRDVLQPWAETIEAESDGRIDVQLYPSMQLGGTPPDLFDQARDGVADVVWTVLGYTPGRFPKAETFELPFIMTDAVATSKAFQEFVEKNAMDEFEGVKLLAVHTHGPGLFHTESPITTLEDLQGMKIRGGSRIINELLDELGATAVGMPVPAVPESLSKGVIEGATIPWEVTLPLKVSELVSNHTGFSGDHGLYTQTFAIVMNQDFYDSLPDDLKQVIDDNSGMELATMAGEAMAAEDKVGEQVAREAGNNIVMLDEAETQRFKEASRPVIEEWVAADEGNQQLLDDARALIAKYSTEADAAASAGAADAPADAEPAAESAAEASGEPAEGAQPAAQ